MQTSFFEAGRDFFKVRFWVGNRSEGKTSRDFVPERSLIVLVLRPRPLRLRD